MSRTLKICCLIPNVFLVIIVFVDERDCVLLLPGPAPTCLALALMRLTHVQEIIGSIPLNAPIHCKL